MHHPKIGCHLLMWRAGDEAALARAFDDIAAAGYAGVEGGRSLPAPRLQAMLSERGLDFVASHTAADRLEENLQSEIAFVQEMGSRFLCVSGRDHLTGDAYRRAGEKLQRAGELCKKAGIYLCYHNHAHEIVHDLFGLRHLLEPTDPTCVQLCLDTYWIAKGGQDPVAVLREYRKRTPYVHWKDLRDGTFAEIGQGSLDWRGIAAELAAWELPWVMVEQDQTTRTPAESARMSRTYIKEKLGW